MDKQVNLGDLAKKLSPSGGGHYHSAHLTLPGDLGALSKLLKERRFERRDEQVGKEEESA